METETLSQTRERVCKGCLNSIKGSAECTVCISPINMYNEECPCSTCIIKMMCIHSCEKFNEYCRIPEKKIVNFLTEKLIIEEEKKFLK